jgi:hypothetical protein
MTTETITETVQIGDYMTTRFTITGTGDTFYVGLVNATAVASEPLTILSADDQAALIALLEKLHLAAFAPKAGA